MAHEVTHNPLKGIEANTPDAHYGVYDHGAHVWAWRPAGSDPVLWMSAQSDFEAGKPIRGGVPVCFPWFGAGHTGALQPGHGFARITAWELVEHSHEGGGLRVEYRLGNDLTGDQPDWPYQYEARMVVLFSDRELSLELTVENKDEQEFTYEEALHTYLAVDDVKNVKISGLDGARYLDKVAVDWATQEGDVTITEETDRVYNSTGAVTVDDGVRKLKITKEGSANTVVWNPWIDKSAAMPDFGDDEWPGMICIEAANALDDAITLQPGETHTLVQRVSIA